MTFARKNYDLQLAYKYSCDQSNQSYDLQNYYWPTAVPLLLMTDLRPCDKHAAAIHTTLQPYCRPEASSTNRQHHKREAYARCIRAHSPSPPRIVGRAGGADA